MTSDKRLGDRREQVRYDVSGQLWAELTFGDHVLLKNIGRGGALIEAKMTPGLRSLRAARIVLRDRGPEIDVVVRHIEPASSSPGEDRVQVGLEFVRVSTTARAELDQFIDRCGAPEP
jgi:hypothetical protein